jgi:hypothetical protein
MAKAVAILRKRPPRTGGLTGEDDERDGGTTILRTAGWLVSQTGAGAGAAAGTAGSAGAMNGWLHDPQRSFRLASLSSSSKMAWQYGHWQRIIPYLANRML